MKDRYSFLKAIDTSSSSPELLNEEEAAVHRSRQKTPQQLLPPNKQPSSKPAQSNVQTPTATNSSSSLNSKTPGKLKATILTNLVRPIKLHSQSQQQATTMRKSHAEKSEAGDLRDRLFSLTGKQHQHHHHHHHLRSSQGGAKLLGAPRLSQPPMAAPMTIISHTRHHHVPPALVSSQHNKTTSSGPAAQPNYSPSETARPTQAQPELARCYDEIDQIYDYIRGLAPLPINLRKIKSIDFEQLERERQKLAERQHQVEHHQHRERYVRSIDDSTATSQSASVPSTQAPASSSSVATRRLVRVRQRDASDQNQVRPPPTIATMPIRVTTRSSESARPSVKRVESLNLGEQKLAKLANQNFSAPSQAKQPVMASGLTKPSYLISTSQRGQVFRLPRAHSTSTLNRPALALAASQTGQASGRRASHAVADSKEPVIEEENLPLVRMLSRGCHAQPQTGSPNRSIARQVAGFESDLVESFVDDDDDDDDDELENNQRQQLAQDEKSAPSSQSQDSSSSCSSSTSSEDGAASPQASERLSQKSHSDYENDSDANTSETTSTETSSETTTNTSNEKDEEQVRARARALKREHQYHHAGKTSSSMSPFSAGGGGGGGGCGGVSTGKRSQRPTTSSSPSSGRPASPADETQPESDGPEPSISPEEPTDQHRKSAYPRRQHLPLNCVQPAPREEHIYEQIPAHKTRLMTTTSRVLCADQPIGATTNSQMTLIRRVPSVVGAHKPLIKHPVAYAANVAVNRRYQQQVAALFALQQQRDRQLASCQPPMPPVAAQMSHQAHRRRASASNTQFLPQWRQASSGSIRTDPHLHQHLSSVPHRHRLSMGNIHLLTSAIPLASLCLPRTKHLPSSEGIRAMEARQRQRSQTNANSLDDHEAGSTGTTNSTSSYEAAIKNSEPNPLGIDMLAPTPDAAPEQRHSAGRRSVASGTGSRSLSNHLQIHNTATAITHHLHQPPQQHSSSLVKVPKLSKQSHLLQRPLPKPPNYHRSSSTSKQLVNKSASNNRTTTTRPPVVDVFN